MARKSIGYINLEWTCPNCGTENPGTMKTCTACGAAQPEDVEFHQPDQQELIKDEKQIERAKKGPDIHCPYCSARNPGDALVCSQCGGDLSEGARRKAGQVVGAFQREEKPVGEVNCPSCGTVNPASNKNCTACGASLVRQKETAERLKPTPPPAAAAKKGASPLLKIIGIGAAIIIALICIIILALTVFKRESATATVQDIHWMRSIEIQELGDITKEDWREEIPADAEIGFCEEKLHHTQDEPAPNAVEVCGTPYSVDTGSGFAEVVQDCQYDVYEDYCEYTIQDWITVDEVADEGSGFNAAWPDPILNTGQRIGDESETYTIVFQTSDKNYTYTTSDYDLYQRCQIGSEWVLTINGLGGLVGIEPAQ